MHPCLFVFRVITTVLLFLMNAGMFPPLESTGGTQTRSRKIESEGYGCPTNVLESRSCNTKPCKIDCVVDDFRLVGECSAQCGVGNQKYETSILTQPSGGGKACPDLSYNVECKVKDCPDVCKVGAWSTWTPCTAACGDSGTQNRTRYAATRFIAPGSQGAYSKFSPTMVNAKSFEYYFEAKCSGDFLVAFTKTKVSSTNAAYEILIGGDNNTMSAIRYGTGGANLITAAGSPCDARADALPTKFWVTLADNKMSFGKGGSATAGQIASVQVPNDLMLDADSFFVGFSSMAESTEVFLLDVPGCQGLTYSESRSCNRKPCPRPCILGGWSGWSECSATCGGGGSRTATRDVLQYPTADGEQCGDLKKTESCGNEPCSPSCIIGQPSPWSTCTKKCGGGTQFSTRTITSDGSSGAQCPSNTIEYRDCNTDPCPSTLHTHPSDLCPSSCLQCVAHLRSTTPLRSHFSFVQQLIAKCPAGSPRPFRPSPRTALRRPTARSTRTCPRRSRTRTLSFRSTRAARRV
jgi:hypothetical protein